MLLRGTRKKGLDAATDDDEATFDYMNGDFVETNMLAIAVFVPLRFPGNFFGCRNVSHDEGFVVRGRAVSYDLDEACARAASPFFATTPSTHVPVVMRLAVVRYQVENNVTSAAPTVMCARSFLN
jgi:hypothetical protein